MKTITTGEEVVRQETLAHIEMVTLLTEKIGDEIAWAGQVHDKSKFSSEEFPYFLKYTSKLKNCTYGSEEYNRYLEELQPALDHHYASNNHHPEHYENGISGMTLVDIVEMLCDWKAATLRHADGDISKSLEFNQKRFGYSDELKSIFQNTVNKYFELDDLEGRTVINDKRESDE